MLPGLLSDFAHLAPDLLRWNLPRHRYGSGGLIAGLLIPLAEYDQRAVALQEEVEATI